MEPECYVLGFQEIDETQVAVVGGKGAHLGELSQIEDIRVPRGFCVTTNAFRRIMAEAPSIDDLLDRLSCLNRGDREAIGELSAEIRRTLEEIAIPDDVAAAITLALARLGEQAAYAVRSSATVEDLPTVSFAGQQDTYLNVLGRPAILQHVSRCWASLFTEQAVTYRLRNGFDHRKVHMAVVVQQMVFPQAAGVLFTADPVTSNRKVASVEASFGLGEALVSGLVNADVYKVRDGEVVAKALATKRLAIHASPAGGTQEQTIEAERQEQPALTDAQVVRLAQLGRRVEAHFSRPQDIEWCLVDDGFEIVQSRPITTLFPIPVAGDRENHVYVSVGHQQMMTDPMKPLGLSVWQLTALVPMYEAGGRLFVDVTRRLASPTSRAGLLKALGRSDPLIGDALQTILERDGFIPTLADEGPAVPPAGGPPAPIETDPAIVAELIERSEASIATLQGDIRTKSGSALLDFILADIQELKRILSDPQSLQVIMAAMEATWWLNEQLQAWLGEKNAADTLTQSVPHNVTSEMGLALLDVADAIRPHPDVVAFLQHVEDEDFLDELAELAGGREARDAIRAFIGYREYPKYGIVSRSFVYKRALLEEAERLVQAGVLREKEDIFHLTLQELHDVVRTNEVDDQLISQRKHAFRSYQALTPPRVLTSEGEVIVGAYRRDDLPTGALIGLPVSGGTIEGRARVILDMAQADLEAGDILVTAYTDPSWTPLFVAIKGLVTEVGGLMTHGAVIAREYGLPAIVGVEHATQLIRDGQRIRVHGTEGYVEILP
jgi:pyruvate,water dikinase